MARRPHGNRRRAGRILFAAGPPIGAKDPEIGTFTGYSALTVAAALPADGRLVACDASGMDGRGPTVLGRGGRRRQNRPALGRALQTLAALRREGADGTFDFALIDADKLEYDGYYEACLELVRPGGLIAVDNALWSGAVADASANDPDTAAIRR